MTTAYNLRNKMYQSGAAGRASRKDPGAGGTVIVTPVDRGTLEMKVTGARTLEAATRVPLGCQVTCVSSVAGASVNGHTLNAGKWAVFHVVLNASGVRVWAVLATG